MSPSPCEPQTLHPLNHVTITSPLCESKNPTVSESKHHSFSSAIKTKNLTPLSSLCRSKVLCEKRRIEKELWRKLLVEFARGHLPPYVLIMMIWKCLKLKVQVYNMVVDISWPSIVPMHKFDVKNEYEMIQNYKVLHYHATHL
ncbi:microtubule-associated protein RP/EB family member 1B [Trifolium repens]|nr:microtubule-associated protein RP/EB family member 1B [Trifolium repens]